MQELEANTEVADLVSAGNDVLTRGMTDRAAALAARACALDPGSGSALKLAAEIARVQGDLAGANEAYCLWHAAAPEDREAYYAACLLSGVELPQAPDVAAPAPFVVEDNFLSPLQQGLVAAQGFEHMDEMVEASVVQSGESQQDDASRSARVLYDPEPVQSWFAPLILAYLPYALPRLGLQSFPVQQVELQLTASYHGDFYKAHHDVTLGEIDSVAGRRISFVYYFQLGDGSFAGGALRLYDHLAGQGTDTRERYTSVLPLANRLVLFRSEALHEVMPVEARSGRAEDGRFTLNGWVHGEGQNDWQIDDRL